MKNDIFLYGAGGHAKVIIDTLLLNGYNVKGIFDDKKIKGSFVNSIPVLGPFRQLHWNSKDYMILSIGNNAIRQQLSNELQTNFINTFHPNAYISNSITIGLGTVVMSGVSINTDVFIGKHAIINTNASIDHDCFIDDFVHISPNACLSGCVSVGSGTHIGAGSVVIPGIKIGKWAIIGAGSVVIANVPDYAVVVGNPGKIIKYTNE